MTTSFDALSAWQNALYFNNHAAPAIEIGPIRMTKIAATPAEFKAKVSTWQEGADAARADKPASACPYHPIEYHFVTWMNGWAMATHNKAKEDDEL